jgi:1-acyl-sn-glycerol-3-phosphate acyltransferase
MAEIPERELIEHRFTPEIREKNGFYFFMRGVIRLINKLYLRMESYGAENLAREGGVLVVANHASHLDPTSVAANLSREVHFLAKEELFVGAFGKFLRAVNSHPLRKSGIDRYALRLCGTILRAGHVLMVFPEGERTKTGELLEPKPGTALIADHAGVPLLPAYIWGSFQSMPTGSSFARPHKVRVFYGKPFRLDEVKAASANKKEFYERAGALIMEKIRELETQARAMAEK